MKKQITRLSRDPGLARSTAWSRSETHFVRMPCVTAAMRSSAGGPPTSTGGPIGTAMQTEVGRLIGKLQVITMSVSRAIDEPAKLTVLLPKTSEPSLPGMSLGAKLTPGGVGM
ncbi:MAG: hypothetical protein IPF99_20855 [Deltaproteobacteria bacterium]|nr:hypothetical protein [Deltaproteobacteria bacterium]